MPLFAENTRDSKEMEYDELMAALMELKQTHTITYLAELIAGLDVTLKAWIETQQGVKYFDETINKTLQDSSSALLSTVEEIKMVISSSRVEQILETISSHHKKTIEVFSKILDAISKNQQPKDINSDLVKIFISSLDRQEKLLIKLSEPRPVEIHQLPAPEVKSVIPPTSFTLKKNLDNTITITVNK